MPPRLDKNIERDINLNELAHRLEHMFELSHARQDRIIQLLEENSNENNIDSEYLNLISGGCKRWTLIGETFNARNRNPLR